MEVLVNRLLFATAQVVVCFLAACSPLSHTSHTGVLQDDDNTKLPIRTEISEVPFYKQKRYQCGPASLAMVLSWNGHKITPDDLAQSAFSQTRKGSLQTDMITTARRQGALAYVIEPDIKVLLEELSAGIPVIVLLNLGFSWFPVWHYAVVIGFNRENEIIALRSGQTKRQELSFNTFRNTWRRSNNWGLVVLDASNLPVTAKRSTYLKAALGLELSKKWKPAATAYRTALKKWPADKVAWMGLGNSLYNSGKVDEAKEVFKTAIEHHKNFVPLLNNYAHILTKQKQWAKAATIACKAARIKSPYQNECLNTLKNIKQHIEVNCR